MCLTMVANLFGIGGGSLMSRLLGEKREGDAKRVGAFSIYGSLGIALVYSLVCLIFTEPLARLLGASDNTVGYASSYLFWAVVVGAVPSTIGMTMSFVIRSAGYSKESGIGLATTQALYKPIAEKDHDKSSAILSATNIFYRKTGIIYSAIVLLLAIVYSFFIPTGVAPFELFIIILLTALPALFSYFIQAKYRLLLEVDGRKYIITNSETLLYSEQP